jgi:hypothetical protein
MAGFVRQQIGAEIRLRDREQQVAALLDVH